MAGPIRIAVLANASQARREIDSVSTRGQRMGKGLKTASRVAAAALLALGAAAFSATKAAAQDEAAQSSLAQQLRTGANATKGQIAQVERYVTAAGKAFGVTDDELRPALSKLATATGSVTEAQRLASIAMDVSTGSGKTLEAVSQALAKAQATGNVAALAKYGVATKDAHGKTLSLAEVTQKLADKYKGAASKAAETTAGKQKRLTVQMNELKEKIGAGLLPVMDKLVDVGGKVVDWIDKNQEVATALAIAIGLIAAAVIAANVAMKIYTAYQIIATAAQWAFNAALNANPIGLIVLAVIAVIAILVIAYKKSDKFREIVDKAAQIAKAAFEAVVNAIKKVVEWIKDKVPPAFETAKRLVVKYVDLMTLPIRTVFRVIKNIATWAKKNVPEAFVTMKNKAVEIGEALLRPFKSLYEFIKKIIRKIGDISVPDLTPGFDIPGIPGLRVGASRLTGLADPSARAAVEVVTNISTVNEQRTYQIDVQVPLGGSMIDAGREIVRAITQYEDFAGRRLAR